MRIINVMIARGLGGIEQAFLDYNNALLSKGFDVLAITDKRAQINKEMPQHPNLKQSKIRFSHLNIFLIYTFYREFKKYQSDLIIVHSKKALSLVICAAKILGIKVVGVAHNPKFKHLDKCDAIFSITEYQRQIFIKKGFAAEKIFVIPNMIAEKRPYKPLPPYKKPPVIGTIGRFDPMKGFPDFVRALALLKQKGIPFRAVLAGGATANYKDEEQEIHRLIQENHLENDIHLPGWIHNKDDFYDQIDIFVLPSKFEPFGIVLLEALIRSLPVVSSLAEGPSEIFARTDAAYLFKIQNPSDMAQKLQDALQNFEQTKQIAANGYNLLQNNYSLPKVAEKLASAINTVLEG
ncbi:MAG: glycosyltransferase family 4 protein [Pseudomonadota bacterium]|nr:glycosyltransferase family 4 protein [Pseudomonadota bacterium]